MITACGPDCGWCGRCSRGPRQSTTCADCGAVFPRRRDEAFLIGALCDVCCDRRDAYTDALEQRLRMAAARLPVPAQKKESA